MLVCGLAPRRKWSRVCDADIFSPPSQTARCEERRGASAIGLTRSNMSRLRIRTTPAASPFGEESSLYPWDSPLGKSNEFRLEHAWLGTTSNLGSLSRLEMTTQFAKGRQDHELSGAPHHRLVLQVPGMLVRNEDGVQDDFDEFKESLKAGTLDLGSLLRGLAFGEENQPVPFGQIRQRFRHAIQDLRRRAFQIDHAAVNERERLALGHLIRQ